MEKRKITVFLQKRPRRSKTSDGYSSFQVTSGDSESREETDRRSPRMMMMLLPLLLLLLGAMAAGIIELQIPR